MKLKIFFTIAILLVCQPTQDQRGIEGLLNIDIPFVIQNLNPNTEDNSTPQTEENTPPRTSNIAFSSVEELCEGFKNGFTDEILTEIESIEKKGNKGAFKKYLKERQGENSIYIPYYQGKMIPLRTKEGFPSVILESNYWLEKPWISRYCWCVSQLRIRGNPVPA